jgi:alkylhydroperoxidase family enzyme
MRASRPTWPVPEPRIEPVPAADALRQRLPKLYDAYDETRAAVLEGGIVDRELKELCARYLAEDEELMDFERSGRFDGRELAALRWTHAIAWSTDDADDELWAQLHAHFDEPELVELGYFVAFTLGEQRWLATLGLGPDGRPRQ